MPRDFQINGESMVSVMVGEHLLRPGSPVTSGWTQGTFGMVPPNPNQPANVLELGLATEPILVRPRNVHQNVRSEDFGPEIPPEIQTMLAECDISMKLIHYDRLVMEACVGESMGGTTNSVLGDLDGTLAAAGSLMGNGRAPGSSGCHYISLNISSPQGLRPWRFPTAFLSQRPVEIPFSTSRSITLFEWRAVPYVYLDFQQQANRYYAQAQGGTGGLITAPTVRRPRNVAVRDFQDFPNSSGVVLWDHGSDDPRFLPTSGG